MKKSWGLLGAALLSLAQASAQKVGEIEMSSRYERDRSAELSVRRNGHGSYILQIDFTVLENTTWSDLRYVTTVRGDGTVVRLRPVSEEQDIRYAFTYRFMRGVADPRPDTGFVYRLPYGGGRPVKALEMSNIDREYFGRSQPKGWKGFSFRLQAGDTVYAVRKGVVVEVTDGYDPVPREKGTAYSSEANGLLVEHADGTYAHYTVLQKGSFLVKTGDTVYPDTPLALVGTYDLQEYQARLMIYFWEPDPEAEGAIKYGRVYFDPVFATSGGERHLVHGGDYAAAAPSALVEKEMTKKVLKMRRSR